MLDPQLSGFFFFLSLQGKLVLTHINTKKSTQPTNIGVAAVADSISYVYPFKFNMLNHSFSSAILAVYKWD